MSYRELFLKKHEDKRLRQGHLWVFSNEIDTKRSPLEQFEAGELIVVNDSGGKALGVAYINPQALICARLLTRKPNSSIGEKFFKTRLSQALALRQHLFDQPYYRLVFGESDGLPVEEFKGACTCGADIGASGGKGFNGLSARPFVFGGQASLTDDGLAIGVRQMGKENLAGRRSIESKRVGET